MTTPVLPPANVPLVEAQPRVRPISLDRAPGKAGVSQVRSANGAHLSGSLLKLLGLGAIFNVLVRSESSSRETPQAQIDFQPVR
jgi:hypothetical protein